MKSVKATLQQANAFALGAIASARSAFVRNLNLLLVAFLFAMSFQFAHATGPDLTAPTTTVEGLVTSAATDWAGIAAISAGALVFAITMRFIRKATK